MDLLAAGYDPLEDGWDGRVVDLAFQVSEAFPLDLLIDPDDEAWFAEALEEGLVSLLAPPVDAGGARGLTQMQARLGVVAHLLRSAQDDDVAGVMKSATGLAAALGEATADAVIGVGECRMDHSTEVLGNPSLRPVFDDDEFFWECTEDPAHRIVFYTNGTLGSGSSAQTGGDFFPT